MRYYLLTFCMIGMWQGIFAQNIIISGTVEEDHSREKIIGANIWEVNSSFGTSTNAYGFYSLSLEPGTRILIFSYVGYQPDTLQINLTRDTVINIHLQNAVQLNTLNVKADRVVRIEEESQMSRNEIPIEQLKKLPAFLGETDVLKTLQLLPGVQSGAEGSTGFYVRGGSIDQNLVLVDGVPIYNPTHVLGIFSAFNADIIRSVSIQKGGYPARYGGRLSSIVDISTKDGHMNEYHGAGQIGLISSKFMVEGPIIPDRSSFAFSIRRTYLDMIARPIIKLQQKNNNEKFVPIVFFHDINAKVNYRFNDKHRLIFSAYFGTDKFGLKENFKSLSSEYEYESIDYLKWGNIVSSLNWNHRIDRRLFANTTLTYTKYELSNIYDWEEIDRGNYSNFVLKYFSGIEDIGIKYNLDYLPNAQHSIKLGTNWVHHTYTPGALTTKSVGESSAPDFNVLRQPFKSVESYFYIEDDISYGSFKVNAGLHYSQFFTEKTMYHSLQPRVSIRYLLPSRWAFKASYANMSQYINLLSSEALSLPTDLWVPSSKRIVPQQSWQLALGIAKTFLKEYEFSIESYYKKMNHVISYKPGESYLIGLGNDWQEKITQGEGMSYGVELLLQRKFGKTSGWIGYTLAWSKRKFDEINRGKYFPYKYDRRHDLAIVLSREISEKWSISGAWIFGTGNAFSLPEATYNLPDTDDYYTFYRRSVSSYVEKNNYRMSNYHRLDISFQREKQKKHIVSILTFGAYNLYSRINPFFVTYDTYDSKIKEVGILPIVPYVSWGFKF